MTVGKDEVDYERPGSSGEKKLRCVIALVRHGDRTVKQKLTVKMSGQLPQEASPESDYRTPAELSLVYSILGKHKEFLLSDPAVLCNAQELLLNGKGVIDNLKAKFEVFPTGWSVKIKWGGDLTALGVAQAEACGRYFRKTIYKENVLHMHASLHHDLKVYSSEDRRCRQTAASFAKGMLELSSTALPVVQTSFVRSDNLGRLDDTPFRHSSEVHNCRDALAGLLFEGTEENLVKKLFPVHPGSAAADTLRALLCEHGNFSASFNALKAEVDAFCAALKLVDGSQRLYGKETVVLMSARWKDLAKMLASCTGNFSAVQSSASLAKGRDSCSSIPEESRTPKEAVDIHAEGESSTPERSGNDAPMTPLRGTPVTAVTPDSDLTARLSAIGVVFDSAVYDFRHNLTFLSDYSPKAGSVLKKLRNLVKQLYVVITPCEYGLEAENKAMIGATFIHPLVRKFRWDIRVATGLPLGEEESHLAKYAELYHPKSTMESLGHPVVRTRLYFAHHSHMLAFLNVLRFGVLSGALRLQRSNTDWLDNEVTHLGYMSEIILQLLQEGEVWTLKVLLMSGDDMQSNYGAIPFASAQRDVFEASGQLVEIDALFTAMLDLVSDGRIAGRADD